MGWLDRARGATHAATHRLSRRAADGAHHVRGRHLLLADVVATSVSVVATLAILADSLPTALAIATTLPVALFPIAIRPPVNERFGLYRRLWRVASVPDLAQIVMAQLAGTVACVIAAYGLIAVFGAGVTGTLPRAFWVVEFMVSVALVGGVRFGIRALAGDHGPDTDRGAVGSVDDRVPALLFGAGRTGALMARAAFRDARGGINPVGFLDADPSRRDHTIAGVPVFGGLDELETAVRITGASMVLITMPEAPGAEVRRIMDAATAAGLEVRRVPAVHELLDGTLNALRIRQVRVEDLLARAPVTSHAPEVAEVIRGQVVMVTGAGGSIGSELARQVFELGPRELVLVDRAESPLYMVQRELELRLGDQEDQPRLAVHIANVASRQVISRLINTTKPSVIFHAAAYKHVPMMEEHPSEALQVNVGGTYSVLSAAEQAGVPHLVLVSTDKAVEPSSVMGATKRLAEWLVADAAARTGRRYVSVRFGNVLGSAGSILPILQAQLERDEPLTVTDPQMTRYFMTIQEAGWLILDAAAIGRAGDLFILDMGEPVRIADLVRDLIVLSGRNPALVPIRVTGRRPGEKQHEKLSYDGESVQPTKVEKILRVKDAAPPPDIGARVRELMQLAFGDRDHELREALFAAVAEPTAQGADVEAAPARHVSVPAPDRWSRRDQVAEPRER